MKKITCILLFISYLVLGSANAQTGVRFGLKSGYSLASQYGSPPADNSFIVETSSRNGFAGGVFAYFPITESVGIQQEFLYAMKGSRQDVTISVPVNINTVSVYNVNYFEMPVVLKYKFVNIKDFGIYGSTGIALSLLMNGDYDITSTVNIAGIPPIISTYSGDMKTLDTFDYSFVYGAGMDFKLLSKDFFVEYRMTVGWNILQMPNVPAVPPAPAAPPVPLRNMDYIFAVGMYF
jgi:hypothetical protein